MFAYLFNVSMTFMLDVLRFFWRNNDNLMFVWPSWLGSQRIRWKNVIFRALFSDNPNVSIGTSCGSVFWVPQRSYFDVTYVIQRPTLTSDRLFDEQYYKGVVILLYTMLFFCVVKSMYEGYWGYFVSNYDILDYSRSWSTSLLLTWSCLQVNTY